MEISESSNLRRFKCRIGFNQISLEKGDKVEVPTGWALSALGHKDLLFSFTKEDEGFFKGLDEQKIASINRQVKEDITSPKDAIALLIPKKTMKSATPKKATKAKAPKMDAKAKKE